MTILLCMAAISGGVLFGFIFKPSHDMIWIAASAAMWWASTLAFFDECLKRGPKR